MPIDRHRRDALSAILLQYLRGELPPQDCWKQAFPLLEEFHRISRRPSKDKPRGFPVLLPGDTTPQCLNDPIIGPHTSRALMAGLFAHNTRTREPEQRWAILTRTLALLRSDLDAPDLAYPRRRLFKPFARTRLACISIMILLATIIAAVRLHPACVIAWPILGVVLLWNNNFFLQPTPPENSDAYPLLTMEQWRSIAHLAPSHEILPYDPARYPPTKPSSPHKKRWNWKLLLLPIAVVSFAIGIAGMLLAFSFVILMWPFFLLDILNKAARNPLSEP